jgi:hypothetical protein
MLPVEPAAEKRMTPVSRRKTNTKMARPRKQSIWLKLELFFPAKLDKPTWEAKTSVGCSLWQSI